MAIGSVIYFANALQRRLSTALVGLGDAIAFLSRTAWPLVDLLIRIWIGERSIILSLLVGTNWSMAASMASGSYPIPVPGLWSTALSSQVYLLASISLILGLATRVGAAVLLAFTVASHICVAALDLNLFWTAVLAYYVLLGADRLSLDRLLAYGLKSSPLPQIGALITFLDVTRPVLTDIYLLALRVALMLTLLLAGGHMSTAMMTTTTPILAWLPVSSATLLFGNAGIGLPLVIGSGLATRATALLAVTMIGYHMISGGDMSFSFYWTALLLFLVAKGPGRFSLDGALLAALRQSLPELSGKPAFNLEGLPRVVIVGAGFGGIACARALRHARASITLIDRQNYHLFQPLLYQVATAALSPADIAIPIREIFRDQFNAKVMLATVTGVDTARREVLADGLNCRTTTLSSRPARHTATSVKTPGRRLHRASSAWTTRHLSAVAYLKPSSMLRLPRARLSGGDCSGSSLLVAVRPESSLLAPLPNLPASGWRRIFAISTRLEPKSFWCRGVRGCCRRFPSRYRKLRVARSPIWALTSSSTARCV
jgi:NADH dehydrogenase